MIEPAELDTLQPKKTKTIEIEDFVELAQIDPIFYDHPYYLAPGPGGAKPYRLLLEAMAETEKVAIARVVIRSKEQLVAIRAMGDVLEMATMLFADEVSSPDRLDELPDPKEVKTTKREVEIAKQLIGSLAGDFEPEKYRDTYREDVLALIERKAEGKEIAVQPEAEEVPEPGARPDERAEGEPRGGARARRPRSDAPARQRKAPAKKAPAKAAAAKAAAAKAAAKKPPAKKAARQTRHRQAVGAARRASKQVRRREAAAPTRA